MYLKTEKLKLSGKVPSVDRLPTSAMLVAVKLWKSAAFWLKYEECLKMSKNVSENRKIKTVRNVLGQWGRSETVDLCSTDIQGGHENVAHFSWASPDTPDHF